MIGRLVRRLRCVLEGHAPVREAGLRQSRVLRLHRLDGSVQVRSVPVEIVEVHCARCACALPAELYFVRGLDAETDGPAPPETAPERVCPACGKPPSACAPWVSQRPRPPDCLRDELIQAQDPAVIVGHCPTCRYGYTGSEAATSPACPGCGVA